MQIRQLSLEKGIKQRTLLHLSIDDRLPESLETMLLGAVIASVDGVIDGEVLVQKTERGWCLTEAGESKFILERYQRKKK